MSFKAELDIDGKNYELWECKCSVNQAFDIQGKPDSAVRGGIIQFMIDGSADDFFTSWIADPLKTLDGSITLYRIDEGSRFKEIAFEKACIMNVIESFLSDEDPSESFETNNIDDLYGFFKDYIYVTNLHLKTAASYITFIRISAQILKVDGIKHDNRWY